MSARIPSSACRRLSSITALALLCATGAPLSAQTASLEEVCRRSAYDRYASNSPKISVNPTGIDQQNNRLFAWTATWSSGRANGSCLVSMQNQLLRFDEASSGDNGLPPAVQPPVVQPVPPPASTTRVLCESKEARRSECAIPLNYRARLVRTMSTSPCIENRSWGTTGRVLWVTTGCRGEFELVAAPTPVGPGYGGGTRRITCGSPAGKQAQCKTLGYATTVRMVRDLSGNRCRQNSNWGYTDSFIWTNQGCRAEFEITYGNAVTPTPGTRRISCGTGANAREQCATGGVPTNVRLVRDLSGSRCRQNFSWGYTESVIWTSVGCRGDFEVTLGGTTGPAPGGGTRTITCGNSYGAQMSCNAFGRVSNARVARDLSNGRCRQGSTWGYSQQDLWVKDGCYADFEITYLGVVPQPR